MSCPTELEWSMFVDEALTADEAERLENHLSSCAACRTLHAALVAESRALRAALSEEDERVLTPALIPTLIPAFRGSARTRGPLAAVAVLIGLASSSFVLAEILGSLRWPDAIAWMNPFTPSGVIDLVFDMLVFVATEGRSMLMSAIEIAGAAVFVALFAGIAFSVASRGRGAAVFAAALAAIAFSMQSQALEIRRSEGLVSVPAGETVDDTLIAMGQNVEIDGTVTGDLIALGQRVVIRGSVEGQLVTGARTVEIEGNLGGSVLSAAETVTLRNGSVARNLYGFAREVTTDGDVEVGGNAIVFGSNASLAGPVAKDVYGFAAELEVSSTVGGDVVAHAGTVRVLETARIEGDVVAHVENEDDLNVSPGATITGTVSTEIEAGDEEASAAERTGSFLVREAVSFGAAFVTGLILLWLVPPLARMSLDTGGESVVSAGVGLVTLVAVPIIAVMTAITLIGLPIAVLAVLAWLAGLYLAKILIAHFIGRKLFDLAGRPAHFALALLVGLLLVYIAINIPLIGGLLSFLLTITGLGMLVIYVWGLFQDRPIAQ